ncbi:MAG: hypothetical protein WAM30_12110, partial [Candidatus Dormiibacterota bacterium]
MTTLLTRAELAPLADEPTFLLRMFDVIEDALVNDHGSELGVASWLRYPVGAGERLANVILVSSPRHGTTLRTWSPRSRSDVLVQCLDAETGGPEVVLQGPPVAFWRTSAPVAVAARHLAPPGARTLGIIGSGTEARLHVLAMRAALPDLEVVHAWSPTAAHREAFARKMGEATGLRVEATENGEDAVRGADIVSLAAFSPAPPITSELVRPG